MSRIKKVKAISRDDIQSIFSGDLIAIHIPGFFSKTIAKKASQYLLAKFESRNWKIGSAKHYDTDMAYLLGIPRSVVSNKIETEDAYYSAALHFTDQLNLAFSPLKSPLTFLRDELELTYDGLVTLEPLNGRPGLPAVVRHSSSNSYKSSLYPLQGICHTDSSTGHKSLSSNIYLDMPPAGGLLKIWNLTKESNSEDSTLYKLIKNFAFDPDYSDKIQAFLPEPETLIPEVGDLIIFDTSLPHAVTGFTDGERVTIQTFIKSSEQGIAIFS